MNGGLALGAAAVVIGVFSLAVAIGV